MKVTFLYYTSIKRTLFKNARIHGSWDSNGSYSDSWTVNDMIERKGEDGCPAFTYSLNFNDEEVGSIFYWGVTVDTITEPNTWVIMTEIKDVNLQDRTLSFKLKDINDEFQSESYYLNESRRLGAQKFFKERQPGPLIKFSAWAPNAALMDVVMGYVWKGSDLTKTPQTDFSDKPGPAMVSLRKDEIFGGYISDQGEGVHPEWGPFSMKKKNGNIWETDINDRALQNFDKFKHAPFMFRVTKDDGTVVYRTDLYSRCQIGFGDTIPNGAYDGKVRDLDGVVSCSVVIDPDEVTEYFSEELWPEENWIQDTEFWKDEINNPPHPTKVEDLIIYELHLGALGFNTKKMNEPGDIQDAIDFLPYLKELGINAIELLPMSQFGGGIGNWGYSTSHHFAVEYSAGGRDQYKKLIRECHNNEISVIVDVVYNHFVHNAERAEYLYDTNSHDKNPFYWYEGTSTDYPNFDANVNPSDRGKGGYIDNDSTAFAPRYWEEQNRKMFISSAIALIEEFYVDGFRLDQTTSIHDYNCLHADGRRVESANQFGKKLLREFTNTMRLIKPDIIIIAEDHSNKPEITELTEQGGMGFDAAWYADFYHHLIGDTDKGSDYSKLIKTAGKGYEGPLRMDWFAEVLACSAYQKVVYNESHDEAGNGSLTDRTIRVASGMDYFNSDPIPSDLRKYGEARCRFAAGVTLLSAGTPMFLFGEEVGAEKKFLYGKVLENREDYRTLRKTTGKKLFEFYQKVIELRKYSNALKSRNIEIIYTHNVNRVLCFRRWSESEEYLIVCCLNNTPYNDPDYQIISEKIIAKNWKEIFNSDGDLFGGNNVGNFGTVLQSHSGYFNCVIPSNGLIVFAAT